LEPATITHVAFNQYQRQCGLEHFKLSKPDPLNGFWQLSELIQLTEHGIYLLVNQDFALRQNILLSMTFYLLFYCFFIAY